MFEKYDVVIIGGGIAGLFTALKLSDKLNIAVITKEKVEISNSILAQGGIAVPLANDDSPKLHFDDTLYAGAGLCNEDAVWVLVNDAVPCIKDLCELGVVFDKDEEDELALTREAAHSKNRIIHSGDSTGKEVCDSLTHAAMQKDNIKIIECTTVLELIMDQGKCVGVLAANNITGEVHQYLASATICATGGFGQLYKYTSNPDVATGDGLAMAFKAGVELVDLEFIQFHPTVLVHPLDNSFLISEAVRGEGAAVLRNNSGERFMPKYHELAELAPRDVVSRAIFDQMNKWDEDNVWLDITARSKEWLQNRFPNIYSTCLKYGIDISKDYIPVAPAAHYSMGGIQTDVEGKTNVENFYACGEVSCTAVHGANRLASNSLLEGLVFGRRIAVMLNETLSSVDFSDGLREVSTENLCVKENERVTQLTKRLKKVMTKKVGIVRSENMLNEAAKDIEKLIEEANDLEINSLSLYELKNMLMIANLVVKSATMRKESRGAHYRGDYTKTDDENWKKNIIWRKDGTNELFTIR